MRVSAHANWFCSAKATPTIWRGPEIGFARQKRAWATSQVTRESRKTAPILESGGGADPRSARNALVPPPRIPGHATSRPSSPQSWSCFQSKPTTRPSPRKLVLFCKSNTNDLAPPRNWLCSAKSHYTSQPTQIGSVLQKQHQRSGTTPKIRFARQKSHYTTHQNRSQPTQIGSVPQNQPQRSGAAPKLALLGKITNPPPPQIGSVPQNCIRNPDSPQSNQPARSSNEPT